MKLLFIEKPPAERTKTVRKGKEGVRNVKKFKKDLVVNNHNFGFFNYFKEFFASFFSVTMIGILTTPLKFVLGIVADCVLTVVENMYFWLLPVLRTAGVVKEQKQALYRNYMCFWSILALLLFIEYTSFSVLYWIPFYRPLRLGFVIWIQVCQCYSSARIIDSVKPVIEKRRNLIDSMFKKVCFFFFVFFKIITLFLFIDNTVSICSGAVVDKLKRKSGELVTNHGHKLLSAVVELASLSHRSQFSLLSNDKRN
ncbi:hypothetical protein RFI_09854 [Reticulomyxa filosa]|uniref:Receptor expression-enhancing protein n=1 Tax=Reticulomyxa filosa TaxID=46433 RepID=X6NLW5_RETFI|nr:hypothetical protein RFI_09854 [Reticulomyxa filosa]|eukprot:ETO27280.1 hypothetical protein RFI_09854 [Reticulomyxa filosa]